MPLAPRPSTVGFPERGRLSVVTRLRACLTTGIALIGVSAIAATPVASHLPEIQVRPVEPAAASETVTEMLAGLGHEGGEVTSEVVSTSGSLGVVGQDGVPVGILFGRGRVADYLGTYAEPAVDTFDNESLGQGVLPLPIATQMIANQVVYLRMTRKTRRSLSNVADGIANVSPALPTKFGDLFSGGITAAFGELQTAPLLLLTLKLKVVLLQMALLNLLVILNRNAIPGSVGGTST